MGFSRTGGITGWCIFGCGFVASREVGKELLVRALSYVGVDVLVSVGDRNLQGWVAAKSEGFVHTDAVHGDQDVERHILAL